MSKIIGIDLGTTNTCVAIMDGKNVKVIAGCADHVVSAFSAGIKKSGDVLLKFGGAGDILIATNKPIDDQRLFLDYHIIPDLFMPNGCMASSGSLLNWFINNFYALFFSSRYFSKMVINSFCMFGRSWIN